MSDLIIDGNKLMMNLADWWYSSFGQEETEEAIAIRKVMDRVEKSLENYKVDLPSAQPEKRTEKRTETHACDLIDRQAAIDAQEAYMADHPLDGYEDELALIDILRNLPSAQPEKRTETHSCDLIDRQAAIDALHMHLMYRMGTDSNKKRLDDWINSLPSAQPEHTCVNCGRTANNGGWYADGRTRCPIEEHYALPKDGFCHLWEKRNVTDDDYPERREE